MIKISEDRRLWKIVLVGDGAVGKTSLRKRYLGEGFDTDYLSTMGADFALHDTNIKDTQIRWQIWDLAGQPMFKDVVQAYYTKVFGGVAVYDVTRRQTFDNVETVSAPSSRKSILLARRTTGTFLSRPEFSLMSFNHFSTLSNVCRRVTS